MNSSFAHYAQGFGESVAYPLTRVKIRRSLKLATYNPQLTFVRSIHNFLCGRR
jgi:hypothetical protein